MVADEGLTVLLRLGELGPLGKVDLTAEGLTFGAILGLRALLIVLASSGVQGRSSIRRAAARLSPISVRSR